MKIMTAVAYARFSSDKQQESSTAVQLSAIRRFCASHNIQLIHEYALNEDLPESYDKEAFESKINLLLNHFIDMAIQGYGWIVT